MPEHDLVEPERAPSRDVQPVLRRTPLVVGAADDRAEREADDVADRVVARLGESHQHAAGCGHDAPLVEGPVVRRSPEPAVTGRVGASGGELDAASSEAIESARGSGRALPTEVRRRLEGGFGHSLSDVRIHTDGRADRLARHVSATAFTTGRDIFFGAGQFAPETPTGLHTLAHEIAHTRQDGGVRRKLHGTAQALRDQGGEVAEAPTLKEKAKAFGRKLIGGKTNWEQIVEAVQAYEKEEDAITGNAWSRPDPKKFQPRIKTLLGLLEKVQTHVAAWRKANEDDEQREAYDDRQADFLATHDPKMVSPDEQADTRTKTKRRQVVNMLAPRVANEILMLKSPGGQEWLDSDAFTGDLVINPEVWKAGGAQNEVVGKTYAKGGGGDNVAAVYKAEHGFKEKRLQSQPGLGFRQIDPNFGARSVALYRLDKLFGAGVTAKAEFAVGRDAEGKSELGQVLHQAGGKAAGHTTWGVDEDHTKKLNDSATDPAAKGKAASLDDPVLQRGLNRLQLLDAIAGQLDRHSGNYFVQVSDGKVTGVTGIDLDEAFGEKMTSVAQHKGQAQEFSGLPDLIDKQMGLRILEVTEKDLRDALYGLLSEDQISATVARFTEVKGVVQQALDNDALEDNWGKETAKTGSTLANKKEKRDQGYYDHVRLGGLPGISDIAGPHGQKVMAEMLAQKKGLKELTQYHDALGSRARSFARSQIAQEMSKLHMPSKHFEAYVASIIGTIVRYLAAPEVVRRMRGEETVGEVLSAEWPRIEVVVTAKMPQLAKPFLR